MSVRPPISFLVPAYNCAGYLPAAIGSILHGNALPDDEILVVDDGSNDDTPAVIEGLTATDPRIRALWHATNRGSAAAGRNTAIDHARHDLFFALDADNLLVPGSVDPLAGYLRERSATAAAFREVRFFKADPTRPTHSWFCAPEITLAGALAGHYWPGPDGNYLFTRDSWRAAGRYDESVGGGIDSWAFGIRQLATGTRMVTLGGSHYLHRWGHDSAWVRDAKQGSHSAKARSVLEPYFALLEQESTDYLASPESRDTWYERLGDRPLRVRGQPTGEVGTVVWHRRAKESPFGRVGRYLKRIFG